MHVYVQADLSQQTSMHLHGRRCCKVEVIIQPPGFLCCIYFRTSWEAVSVASRRNLTDNDWMTFERKVATCKSTVLTHVSWLISRFAFCLMLRPQFMDTPSLLLWSCRQHIKYTSRPVSRQEIHVQVDFISDLMRWWGNYLLLKRCCSIVAWSRLLAGWLFYENFFLITECVYKTVCTCKLTFLTTTVISCTCMSRHRWPITINRHATCGWWDHRHPPATCARRCHHSRRAAVVSCVTEAPRQQLRHRQCWSIVSVQLDTASCVLMTFKKAACWQCSDMILAMGIRKCTKNRHVIRTHLHGFIQLCIYAHRYFQLVSPGFTWFLKKA